MKKTRFIWYGIFGALLVIIIAAAILGAESPKSGRSGEIKVVAAENFWGSLVSQIGGNRVQVTSVVSDPNADPHEYEASTADARAFSSADYVILNGAGYDSWGDKLLAASPNANRKVLNVADLLGKKNGDNPHFWYSPDYVNRAVARMEQDLIALDPKDAGYFRQNYARLTESLSVYQGNIASIKRRYAGTEVAATEDVFYYLAQAAGLDLVSPPAFTRAVSEGNDPPSSSVVQFQQQLKSGKIRLLVFNKQTVTPLTDNMKAMAASLNIPVVGVTEIVQPSNQSFQDWMGAEVVNIENALNGAINR